MERNPFRSALGLEAVLLIELELQNLNTQTYEEVVNHIGLKANLDVIDEAHNQLRKRVGTYQQRMARYYDKKICHKGFKPGNLVCRNLEATRLTEGKRKKMASN